HRRGVEPPILGDVVDRPFPQPDADVGDVVGVVDGRGDLPHHPPLGLIADPGWSFDEELGHERPPNAWARPFPSAVRWNVLPISWKSQLSGWTVGLRLVACWLWLAGGSKTRGARARAPPACAGGGGA